jgi:hypothetical protein
VQGEGGLAGVGGPGLVRRPAQKAQAMSAGDSVADFPEGADDVPGPGQPDADVRGVASPSSSAALGERDPAGGQVDQFKLVMLDGRQAGHVSGAVSWSYKSSRLLLSQWQTKWRSNNRAGARTRRPWSAGHGTCRPVRGRGWRVR